MPNLCFEFDGICGFKVHSGAFGVQNVDTLLFMLLCARCESYKKHAGTCVSLLVFLHSVGSVGHIVCSGASRV
jgi:hypothetical protein